jgi:hypothetical protein
MRKKERGPVRLRLSRGPAYVSTHLAIVLLLFYLVDLLIEPCIDDGVKTSECENRTPLPSNLSEMAVVYMQAVWAGRI